MSFIFLDIFIGAWCIKSQDIVCHCEPDIAKNPKIRVKMLEVITARNEGS